MSIASTSTTRTKKNWTIKRNKYYNLLRESHPVTLPLEISKQLRSYRHYLFPGLNTFRNPSIFEPEDAVNFYQPPPAVISKPIPVLSTLHTPIAETPSGGDRVLKLVEDKFSWRREIRLKSNLARRSLRNCTAVQKIKKDLKEKTPINTLPYVITKLAYHYKKNPDEYFDGVYNWYHGSSIATANFGDQTCLLFAGGKNMNEFWFSFYNRASSSETVPGISPQLKIPLADDNPIHEIIPAKDYTSVGVRQRDNCYFFIYDDDPSDITLQRCLKVEKQQYPFVSMDSAEREFCTVDLGRNIKFWTPRDAKFCFRAFTLPKAEHPMDDLFAQIRYASGKNFQEFVVMDRKHLYHYDKRVSTDSPMTTASPVKSIEWCDELSLLVPSLVQGYWYVGANHTCLLYDARAGFVQKWAHMMTQTPVSGTTFHVNKEKNNPKECLLLASQSTDEMVAIYNKWTGEESTPNVLPVGVPCRIDTLHEARCKGLLTDPSIDKRFSRCCIGMTAYKKKKRIGVFTLCSTGDIFHHYVYRRKRSTPWNPDKDTALKEPELNHLRKWQTDYIDQLSKTPSNLVVTEMVQFKYLPENLNYGDPEIPVHPAPNLRGRAMWKKSKKTLESYQDFLAPHILHDFGLDEESEWGTDDEEEVPPTTDDDDAAASASAAPTPMTDSASLGKVKDWLSRTMTGDMETDDMFDVEDLFSPVCELTELTRDHGNVEVDVEDVVVIDSDDESVGHASRMSYGTI